MKYFWLYLVILVLVACQPIAATPTATSIPTSTVAPTPTIEKPIHYELQQPQPADLLKMIDAVLKMEKQITYHEDVMTNILEREPGSMHYLLGVDFAKFYQNGFAGAEHLVDSPRLPWESQSFGEQGSFSVVLRIAVLQYINAHPEVLTEPNSFHLPNATIRIFSLDIDGDHNLEWLVGAEYPDYSLQNWLLIRKEFDGRYHLIPGLDPDWVGPSDSAPDIVIKDVTGDGNPEIIKIHRYYFAGGIHGGMEIYTWKANKLSLEKSIDLLGVPPVYGETYESDYMMDDFNKDGVSEIRVTWPRFRRFGCQWTQTTTYFLDGRYPDVAVQNAEIPQTNACLVARALESDNTQEQIQLYQRALGKLDQNTVSKDEVAWIKLQLSMDYTANGDDVRAELQLRDLIQMKGDGAFLKFIKNQYIKNESPLPLAFCDILYLAISSQDGPQSLGSDIDVDLTHGAYPIDFAPVPELVCPFPDVLSKRLEELSIPVSKSPIDVLNSKGYKFLWTKSLNGDGKGQSEWLGVLDFHQPMLVSMKQGKAKWILESMEVDLSAISEFDANVYAPVDGSGSRVLVLLAGKGKYCELPKTVKWLLTLTQNTQQGDSQYLCDANQYSLQDTHASESAIQAFSKPNTFEMFVAPDWYYLPNEVNEFSERKTVLDLVNEIERNVVGQTNFQQTTSQISQLISALPKDDSAAQILLSQLSYLQGLNYELGNHKERAVEAYIKLIETFPKSLWSEYAKIRLKAVP